MAIINAIKAVEPKILAIISLSPFLIGVIVGDIFHSEIHLIVAAIKLVGRIL